MSPISSTPTAISSDAQALIGRVLEIDFDLVSYRVALDQLLQWREEGRRNYICITNPHSVLLCRRDEQMDLATRSANLILPDGVGIILACKVLGYPNHGRVTGPTLMLRFCDWGRSAGLRHYFYGGQEHVSQRLVERLCEQYPGMTVAGRFCPPFRALSAEEDARIVEQINASRPDVVWVGLGAPKQEKWMLEHAGNLSAAAMVGVGAAFDFHSGNVKWAPAWVRRLGLEWAHRLLTDPVRMWRRNLDSPRFLRSVLWQRLRARAASRPWQGR